jgi:hypothetical protein
VQVQQQQRRWRGAKVRERESRESRGLLCIAGGISPETRVYVVAREKSRTKWGSL